MKQGKKGGGAEALRERPLWGAIIVMVACFVLLTLSMILASSPQRYSLSVGDIAATTITATKEVVDEVATEQRRERAAEGVLPTYREDESANLQVLSRIDDLFEEFENIRAYGEGIRTGTIPSAAGEEVAYTGGSFQQADLDYARTLGGSMALSNWQLTILMRQSEADLRELHETTRETVRKQMESTIREGQVETAISAIQRQVLPTTSSDLALNIAIPAVRASLMPNMVIDQDATEANRELARQEIEPSTYKSGQNIIVAGERVTAAQIAVLDSLGLLEGNRFDMMMMVGVGLLSLLVLGAMLFSILQFDRKTMAVLKNMLLLAVIFLLTMVLCVAISKFNIFLVPVSMVVLLCAALLSPSIALTGNVLALILVSVLTNSSATNFTQQMLYFMVCGVLSAPVGVYITVRLREQRASVLLAGIVMGLVNLVAMVAIGLLINSEIRVIINNAVWMAGGTVLASFLCVGAQPVLEWLFNLVTPFKLIELSNPNHPLLRRLLVETPGTYHHSIMVANLSEAAAEAIGADALLARVGAYYHDIGKLKRPLFFKENQLGDNPHDRTDPRISAAIIIEHVTDGAKMARQHRLPEQVTSFITQHHGDSLVGYFYHKIKNMPGGETASIEDFQYPGPKPQTAETAIVMMADTVEAAIRAGGDQPVEVIEKRVRELVQDKMTGGQLDESPLQFAEMTKIVRAFSQVLVGIYHKRIEYPQLQGNMQVLPPVQTRTALDAGEEKPADAT